MDSASQLKVSLGKEWLPELYREKVRSQRTRAYRLDVPPRENAADIQYTLLGIDLKIGKRRFACPDLATARYIRLFARLGCGEFALPYDITGISAIADELEVAWQKTLLLIDEATSGKSLTRIARTRSAVIKAIRTEIIEIGAGDAMPEFNRPTRQRQP